MGTDDKRVYRHRDSERRQKTGARPIAPLWHQQQPMFLGEYNHALDEKGRLSIPAKFRAALKKGAVVTRGLDGSLVLYTLPEWKTLAEKLAALPISKQTSRAFVRLMLAGAMDVSLDAQGRITIPEYLRQYASMTKNIVIAGLYNRLELWDDAAWETFKRNTEARGADIAEQLSELGI